MDFLKFFHGRLYMCTHNYVSFTFTSATHFPFLLSFLRLSESAFPEILSGPPGPLRGFGNSFQPAIDASRINLMNCVIAPSAKITLLVSAAGYVPRRTFLHLFRLWVLYGI